ncbi:MAG: hypothetical protein ABW252_00465 [Polyangiales bacterium]
MSFRLRTKAALSFPLALAGALAACSGDAAPALDQGTQALGGGIRVTPIAELAGTSSDDYAANEHGVVTGDRLRTWLRDWPAKKPAGITGRLVVLQVAPSVEGATRYVTPAPERGVLSYLVPTASLVQTRNNGLSEFEAEIPDGPAADALLARYGLDPRHDLIVLTFEQQPTTANSIVHSIGRAWLLLRYWGVEAHHVALLNGSVDYNATTHGLPLSTTAERPAPTPPGDGKVSVRDLRVDNTGLVITLEEILPLLRAPDAAERARVSIVDARGGAEALGLRKATSTGRTDCASYDADVPANRRCSTPFEGRIKGAHSVPWTQFLDDAAHGFGFLSKARVKEIFDAQAEVTEKTAYLVQYCRTNQRSTVTGIVASVILGYPTRFYETSFIEWGHIAHGPTANTQVVPKDFPYRTDLADLTEHAELSPADAAAYVPGLALAAGVKPLRWVAGPNYNADADVSPVRAGWPPVDLAATTTAQSVASDRAYLRGE